MSDPLIYFGAGWDIKSLLVYGPLREYSEYILIDALPNKPHYRKGQYGYPFCDTLDSLYRSLCDEFGKEADDGIKSYPWIWKMKSFGKLFQNDRVFKYYYNTNDCDMDLKGEYDVYLAGYYPNYPEDFIVRRMYVGRETCIMRRMHEGIVDRENIMVLTGDGYDHHEVESCYTNCYPSSDESGCCKSSSDS